MLSSRSSSRWRMIWICPITFLVRPKFYVQDLGLLALLRIWLILANMLHRAKFIRSQLCIVTFQYNCKFYSNCQPSILELQSQWSACDHQVTIGNRRLSLTYNIQSALNLVDPKFPFLHSSYQNLQGIAVCPDFPTLLYFYAFFQIKIWARFTWKTS